MNQEIEEKVKIFKIYLTIGFVMIGIGIITYIMNRTTYFCNPDIIGIGDIVYTRTGIKATAARSIRTSHWDGLEATISLNVAGVDGRNCLVIFETKDVSKTPFQCTKLAEQTKQ